MIEHVIKDFALEKKAKGKQQPGLDFTRAVLDVLILKGLASTGDCCTYTLGGKYNVFIPLTGDTITLLKGIVDNLINPAGTIAALTIKLPVDPADGQIVQITFADIVTTLTMNGNGNTLLGTAATSAAVGTRLTYKFYKGVGWIRLV